MRILTSFTFQVPSFSNQDSISSTSYRSPFSLISLKICYMRDSFSDVSLDLSSINVVISFKRIIVEFSNGIEIVNFYSIYNISIICNIFKH